MNAIIVYSFTGNNRLLADHVGSQAEAEILEVQEKRKRNNLSVVMDLLFRRRPPIEPLRVDTRSLARLLFAAPVWDRHVALPMQSAMRQLRGRFGACAFASLCGTHRPGQEALIRKEVTDCSGAAPEFVCELPVTDLSTPERPLAGIAASNYSITPKDLECFSTRIERLIEWVNAS